MYKKIFKSLFLSMIISNLNIALADNKTSFSPEDGPPITLGSSTTTLHTSSTTTTTTSGKLTSCIDKRGKVNFKRKKNGKIRKNWAVDSILWCPDDFPQIITCNTIDDSTPDQTPTKMDKCHNDGECRNKDSKKEGPENQYTEFVYRHTDNVQGCWAYDRRAEHRPYKIEILCCKQEN